MTISRPNLFIVGAPKCGTTAWVSYLSRHRDIYFSDPKEPHHFNTDLPSFQWFPERERYLELFACDSQKKWVGEASVLYLYSKSAANNIQKFNSNARVLIFVRRPEEFLPSYHQQLLYNLDEDNADLAQVWRLSGQRVADTLPRTNRSSALVDYKSIAAFGEQSRRYVDRFGADQVRIVRFEQWVRDPRGTHRALMQFLGLRDDGQVDFPKVNAAHDHRSHVVAALTQRPPKFAKILSRKIRQLPGAKDLRPAHFLRRLNRKEGYRNKELDHKVARQIVAHYRDDQALLDELYLRVGLRVE